MSYNLQFTLHNNNIACAPEKYHVCSGRCCQCKKNVNKSIAYYELISNFFTFQERTMLYKKNENMECIVGIKSTFCLLNFTDSRQIERV